MSPGDQLLDLVYIDDVVDAFIAAARYLQAGAGAAHEIFALSSGDAVSLREVATRYGRIAGRPLPIRWGSRPYREREVMVPWFLGSPIPGWTPHVSLEEGLRRVIAHAQSRAT